MGGGTECAFGRARLRVAVQALRLLLARCATRVFLILPIEASRLHSAGNSGRSGAAGGLSEATDGTRLLSSEVASRGTCARSVCDDRSRAADRLRGWTASAARGQADVRCVRNI